MPTPPPAAQGRRCARAQARASSRGASGWRKPAAQRRAGVAAPLGLRLTVAVSISSRAPTVRTNDRCGSNSGEPSWRYASYRVQTSNVAVVKWPKCLVPTCYNASKGVARPQAVLLTGGDSDAPAPCQARIRAPGIVVAETGASYSHATTVRAGLPCLEPITPARH
jgi:hypothetical protein